MQTGLEKNLFGNHPFSLPSPPPAFTSDPLVAISSSPSGTNETGTGSSKISVSDIIEIDSPGSVPNYMKNSSTGIVSVFSSFFFSHSKQFVRWLQFLACFVIQTSRLLQHGRLVHKLSDKILNFHTLQMMKMGTVKSTVEGVSINLSICEVQIKSYDEGCWTLYNISICEPTFTFWNVMLLTTQIIPNSLFTSVSDQKFLEQKHSIISESELFDMLILILLKSVFLGSIIFCGFIYRLNFNTFHCRSITSQVPQSFASLLV